MRVLLINNFFSNYGGAEKIFFSEAELLKKHAHETFYFATSKQPFFDSSYKYFNFFPDYVDYRSLNKIELLKHLNKLFYCKDAELKLNLLINEIKPDIIHCHNIYYHLTPSVLKACYIKNIPVVMTLHDCRSFCPSATMRIGDRSYCHDELCVSGSPLNCIKYSCKEASIFKSILVTSEFLYRKQKKLFNNIACYITPSEDLKRIAIKSGISEDKIFVISNFLTDDYLEKQTSTTNNKYFLYAGRLSSEKGLDILIEAMNTLNNINLRIVGKGPEEEKLKRLVEYYNLTNINFVGYKYGKDLEDEYNNCIATILPSDWFENSPLSVLESFAYGKPVIASNIGGLSEIIDHNLNGLLFKPGNVDQLIDSIKHINNNKEIAVSMGKNAKNKFIAVYNSQIHYEKLFNVYQKAINP